MKMQSNAPAFYYSPRGRPARGDSSDCSFLYRFFRHISRPFFSFIRRLDKFHNGKSRNSPQFPRLLANSTGTPQPDSARFIYRAKIPPCPPYPVAEIRLESMFL